MFSMLSYSGKQETSVLSSVWVKRVLRTSLVVQWPRFRTPMQGPRFDQELFVRFVRELNPTCGN